MVSAFSSEISEDSESGFEVDGFWKAFQLKAAGERICKLAKGS